MSVDEPAVAEGFEIVNADEEMKQQPEAE